jgi:hypothetical protein
MAIFASTTTSGYSDPMKAMTIKALEQRQKDLLAQQAAEKPDAAMMATIPGGIGHVLGVVGDRMQQGRADQALAAQKETLARVMAGVDWEKGPTSQQVAIINSADPELARQALSTLAENRRAAAQIASTNRGQDITAQTTTRGQDVTARGQDITASTATRGQDIDARGQDITARGQDIGAQTATRGQDMTANTAARGQDIDVRGQDIGANTAARGQDITVRGQDIGADTATEDRASRERNAKLTADATVAAAAADPVKAKAVAELEQQLTQKNLMVNELGRAQEALDKGIFTGPSAGGQTALGNAPLVGNYLGDKEKAQRTTEFDNTMNKVATGAMSNILKGQSTDFEMKKFIAMYNNPNISMETKRAAFGDVLAAAKRDREIEERAVRKVGGDTTQIAPSSGAAPAPAGGEVVNAASEADALKLSPGTRFKLPDGRTGTAR